MRLGRLSRGRGRLVPGRRAPPAGSEWRDRVHAVAASDRPVRRGHLVERRLRQGAACVRQVAPAQQVPAEPELITKRPPFVPRHGQSVRSKNAESLPALGDQPEAERCKARIEDAYSPVLPVGCLGFGQGTPATYVFVGGALWFCIDVGYPYVHSDRHLSPGNLCTPPDEEETSELESSLSNQQKPWIS